MQARERQGGRDLGGLFGNGRLAGHRTPIVQPLQPRQVRIPTAVGLTAADGRRELGAQAGVLVWSWKDRDGAGAKGRGQSKG